jgi:hypothetical protein
MQKLINNTANNFSLAQSTVFFTSDFLDLKSAFCILTSDFRQFIC